MSNDDLAARLVALEARVAELEAVNARLVDVSVRLFDLIADRTLEFTEQIVSVDERVTGEATEKFNAFLSNATDIVQLQGRVGLVELALSRRGSLIFVPIPDEGM